jgi:hypothetical protein
VTILLLANDSFFSFALAVLISMLAYEEYFCESARNIIIYMIIRQIIE